MRLEASVRLMLAAVLTDLQDLPAARVGAEAGLRLRRRELPAGHVAIAEDCNALSSVLGGAAEHGASLELGGQRLSAAELVWFDLGRAGLVVLSACDTARGSVVAGEHLLGLQRALRLAGAAASVTALWRIDDEATAAFMVSFWTKIARGAVATEALRRSKLAALAAARQQHGDPLPGRWAAFVLEGH